MPDAPGGGGAPSPWVPPDGPPPSDSDGAARSPGAPGPDWPPPSPLTGASPPPKPAPPGAGGTLRPAPSLALAAAAMFGGVIFASILGAIAIAVTGDTDGPAVLVAGFVGLWIPLAGAAVVASKAFGSRSLERDLGLAFEPSDILRGIAVGLIGLAAASAVQFALSPFPRLTGTNTNYINDQAHTTIGAIVVAFSTMIGAPIVEELFFRGLVQRSLFKLGVGACFVQAAIFGFIHVTPEEGLGNVGIMLGVGTFGLVLGLAARRFGRLGPTMVAHATFNAAAVIPLLLK